MWLRLQAYLVLIIQIIATICSSSLYNSFLCWLRWKYHFYEIFENWPTSSIPKIWDIFSFDFFYFFSKHNQWTKSQISAETKKRQKEQELLRQAEEKIKNGLKVDLKIKIRIEILNTSSFYGPFHNLFQNLFLIYRFSATRWSQIHFYMD